MRLRLRILLTVLAIGVASEPCSEYGCPHPPQHEPFVPALPGHTPRCAKPGQTFCESLDHYPQELIRYLIDKWNFDYSTILIDESRDDFNSYRMEPEYHHGGYEYHRPELPQLYPHPIPFLPPQYPFGPPSNVYGPPTNGSHHPGYVHHPNPFRSHGNSFPPQSHQISPHLSHLQDHFSRQPQSNPFLYPQGHRTLDPLGQSPGWWGKRYTRSNGKNGVLRKRPDRSPKENPLLDFAKSKRHRVRRQADGGNQSTALCLTQSQYIMPKAALNNRGNWMYVVNLQEQGDMYTQLVKSETCASTTCNGLCSLPTGYSSRCQQQYVQKRLVALAGTGSGLYNDVFWFPHCCTCQVSFDN